MSEAHAMMTLHSHRYPKYRMMNMRHWMKLCEMLNVDALAADLIDTVAGMTMLGEASENDLDRIKRIAEQFRAWMESEHGWDRCKRKGTPLEWARFEGECNAASRKLAEIYRENGFDARTIMVEYYGDDLDYWATHGSAFYQSEEEFKDAEPWEYGESHEVVLIDDRIIVDVTADQFNPTNPQAHGVIVTTIHDRRYR